MPVLQTGLAKSAAADYTIDQSLRFDDGDSAYLSRTPSSTNDGAYTLSFWIKRSLLGTSNYIYSSPFSNANGDIRFSGGDKLQVYNFNSVSANAGVITDMVFRDTSAWYHVVVSVDNVTLANRQTAIKIYVNGVSVSFTNEDYNTPTDTDRLINTNIKLIGSYNGASTYFYDGYLAEVHFIDGQALTPASFGETDAATGQWKPIDASGLTFGTNGFYQKYSSTELAASFEDSALHQPHTVTAVGDAHTDTSVKKFGTASAQFDDVDSYLSIPDNEDFNLSSGDFTIECWVRFNALTFQPIYSQGLTGSGTGEYHLCFHNSNGLQFIHYPSGGGDADINVNQGGITGWAIDTWYHVALTRSNTTYSIFRDGTELASSTDASTINNKTSAILIGALHDSSVSNFNDGYIDEFRVSKGIARYVGAFTPSTTAFTSDQYTKLLLHCDGADDGTTFTDSADSAPRHTITANGDVTNTRAQSKVGDSSIKFDGTGDYLSVPDSSDWQLGGGTGDFTIECWVNNSDVSDNPRYMGQYADDNNRWYLGDQGGVIRFYAKSGGVVVGYYYEASTTSISNGVWYHVAFVRSGSTAYLFVDGVSITLTEDTAFGTLPNVGSSLAVGSLLDRDYLDGYMDEIRISDTARYTTTFTPSTTEFTADSNTKLLIHSDFDGGLGADSSGNGNAFAVTNLVATDQMVDSPTNNFCTINPLASFGATLSEGNLRVTGGNDMSATLGAFSGKWYWELSSTNFGSGGNGIMGGVYSGYGNAANSGIFGTQDVMGCGPESSNYFTNEGGYSITSISSNLGTQVNWSSGDIISFELDLDSTPATIKASINNGATPTMSHTFTYSGAYPVYPYIRCNSSYFGVWNFGQDSSFAGLKTAQGNQDGNGIGDFYYEPPTDYLALCSSNLASPEIALPTAHFSTKLYTGDGSDGNAITGVGFQPDFLWIKERSTTNSHRLYDSIRGVNSALMSNANVAENQYANYGQLESFDSDGFTVGQGTGDPGNGAGTNASGEDIVAWNWLAGGAAVSNTDGTITSSVSANPTAGFSIASYTGTGSAATIGHGLSSAPELIIVKNRDEDDAWQVGSSKGIDFTDYLVLNTDAGTVDNVDRWNDTVPSASVFTIGDGVEVNTNTEDYIAYCFHSVEGYSKVGTYTGNGVADGPFIYTGFRPAWLMNKYIDGGAGYSWQIADNKRNTYNVVDTNLLAELSLAEGHTWSAKDFVSNGFKIRGTNNAVNIGSGVFLYIAFAESPFKTSNAR